LAAGGGDVAGRFNALKPLLAPAARLARFARFAAGPAAAVERRGGLSFELVTERIEIAALEAAEGSLALARPDEVFEAPGALSGWFAAFGAAFVSEHAQLVFALARDLQVSELVFDALVHVTNLSMRKASPGDDLLFF
jgi:hypothetical protein